MSLTSPFLPPPTSRSERWSPEETALFYRALRAFGTDFTLIAQLFPARDRKNIKNKFCREERESPQLVGGCVMVVRTCRGWGPGMWFVPSFVLWSCCVRLLMCLCAAGGWGTDLG